MKINMTPYRYWILSILATMSFLMTTLPTAQAGPFDKFKKAIPGMGGDETPQLSAADPLDQQAELMEQLTDESKQNFASSLRPYGLGSAGMITSSKTAAATASSLTSSADPQILAKMDELKSIISFGKAAPSIISGFKDTTASIIKFAQANNIDTSELEADIADW
jgi:hypothetical protein